MESDSVEGSPAPQSTSNSVQLIIDSNNQTSQHDESASSHQHGSESVTSPQHVSESVTSPQHGSESASSHQHGSESTTSPQHGSESPPNPGSESISTARDLIRPSSLPTQDTADLANINSPVVIKHPYMDLVDSGSSAPNSPTPGKALKKKAKKKKRHSSKSSPKSSPLVGSASGSHVGVTSPLTNQIGPAVSSAGPNFPSMSQLVNEISSLNNPVGGGQASGRVTSSQIDTEMMQIDSILRALNTGTFDDGNMATIQQLTAQRPQNVISTVQKSLGLTLIGQLGSDDDDDDDDDDSSSSDSGLSSSDDEEEEEDSKIIDEADEEEEEAGKKGSSSRPHGYPMVKGEVDYRDLPPMEEFTGECPPSAALSAVGKISHTAEKLNSNDSTPPLDEGSVFWTADRQPIGKLFETFGPVKKPYYSVRLREPSGLCAPPAGTDVFVILGTSEMTKYVFTDQLLKLQGSDASWLNDNEIPEELQDYSDDEKEQAAHRKKKKTHQSASSLQSAQPAKLKSKRARKEQTSAYHYSGQHQVYASSQQPPNAPSFTGANDHSFYPPPHPPSYGPSPSGQFYPPPPAPAWTQSTLPYPPTTSQYPVPRYSTPPTSGQHLPPPHMYSWPPQQATAQPIPPPPMSMWCHPPPQTFHGLPPSFP